MVRLLPLALCALGAFGNLDDRRGDSIASRAAGLGAQEAEAELPQGSPAEKEALAVAKAAGEALMAADATLNDRVVALAVDKAKKIYLRLRKKGTDATTAAESAAVVAAAIVDQARDQDEKQETVQAAETAAVLAERAVAADPNNPGAASRMAQAGVKNVITAETVAADGARAGVAEAERSGSSSKEEEAATAAVDAAVAALGRVGVGASSEVERNAEAAGETVFEALRQKDVPEELAAKQAAQVVVDAVDSKAPTLVKQSAEAAAEAAAKAVEGKKEGMFNRIEKGIGMAKDITTAELEKRAAADAAETVHEEKLAQNAAVEAVEGVTDDLAFPGSASGLAEAAAAAAVDTVKAKQTVPELTVSEALSQGQDAFEKAMGEKDATVQAAAEKAADAAIKTIDKFFDKSSPKETFVAAAAAAVAAAEALKDNPGSAAGAIEAAKEKAAPDHNMENLRQTFNNQNAGPTVVFLGAVFVAMLIYMNKQMCEEKPPNKYQIAAASIHEEAMDSMDNGSILLTDRGFSKIDDSAFG